MEIIDAQLHIWEEHTSRPWDKDYPALALAPAFPLETAVALLTDNGVVKALLDVLPAYRRLQADGSWLYDNSYAEEAIARHPGRFASTLRIDPQHADIETLVAQAAAEPYILALRVVFRFPEQIAALDAGQYDRLFTQAQRSSIPVMLFITGHLHKAASIAQRYPSNLFIIDHLGLPQAPRPVDRPPFKALPDLLALATLDNVAVKLIGAPALSEQPFPYHDLWDPLQRLFDAFGLRRLMWGSDYTRLRYLFTYDEHIDFIRDSGRLSSADLELLLGGNLRRLLNWPLLPIY